MKNVKIGEKNNICLFYDHDFCKRLEVLLQSCIELNPNTGTQATDRTGTETEIIPELRQQTNTGTEATHNNGSEARDQYWNRGYGPITNTVLSEKTLSFIF
jgi:hypothetical protein